MREQVPELLDLQPHFPIASSLALDISAYVSTDRYLMSSFSPFWKSLFMSLQCPLFQVERGGPTHHVQSYLQEIGNWQYSLSKRKLREILFSLKLSLNKSTLTFTIQRSKCFLDNLNLHNLLSSEKFRIINNNIFLIVVISFRTYFEPKMIATALLLKSTYKPYLRCYQEQLFVKLQSIYQKYIISAGSHHIGQTLHQIVHTLTYTTWVELELPPNEQENKLYAPKFCLPFKSNHHLRLEWNRKSVINGIKSRFHKNTIEKIQQKGKEKEEERKD